MSFTSEIRNFSKDRLRSTSTAVTQLDGSQWIETRPSDEHGYVVSPSPGDLCSARYGYVVDVVPDLQIGWILPNLLLGKCASDTTILLQLLLKCHLYCNGICYVLLFCYIIAVY